MDSVTRRSGTIRFGSLHLLLLLAILVWPPPASALTIAPEVEEEVKRIVAMIECQIEDAGSFGAAIIFGHHERTVYLATAEHVVRPCRQAPGKVTLQFRDDPDRSVTARISPKSDGELDLTVLIVEDAALPAERLPLDRLGDPESLARGSRVFSLGWSNRPWALSVTPEPVAELARGRIYYDSNFISPGHSGGALLDENMLVMGMLRSDQPPWGEAISMTRLLERVREWGYPVQLSEQTVPKTLHSLVFGGSHMCGLDASGAAYCWGGRGYAAGALGTGVQGAITRRVVGGLRFQSIIASAGSTCGLLADGRAYCWGRSRSAPLGEGDQQYAPTPLDTELRFQALALGEWYTCGIALDRLAYCWGENELGQLGNNKTDYSSAAVRVAADVEFASISAGSSHTCALTEEGTAYCWGHNLNGEAGVGSRKKVLVPSRVAGDLRFDSISASRQNACGVTVEGDAYCWGQNRLGQVGSGDRDHAHHTPTAVAGGLEFASVSAGTWHSCGISRAGSAYCWGKNEDGALGSGSEDSSSVPVRVAGDLRFRSIQIDPTYGSLTCGVTKDGALYCWGSTEVQSLVGDGFPIKSAVRAPRRITP